MIATLTGLGLSSAAGLNAYIPLLMIGLLARYTDLVDLGSAWAWLEHPATLVVVGLLLVLELVADKVPAVDSINDVVQTVVRPTAGGITFGAGADSVDLADIVPAEAVAASGGGVDWGAVIAGVVVALVFHVIKAGARPVINTATVGTGGPVVSVAEDVASALTSFLAIVLPLLIVVVFPLMLVSGVWAVRRGRRRRAERRTRIGNGADAP
ncbi:DUF4126 domain-containing protein [Nocardiopsis sp. LOL_012]|uniref:DUF4126 domain-containing protein n=1 Tax=Nocardiopsis sp. LOL_012 TaxID=3345409 RepID=UPI003A892BD7